MARHFGVPKPRLCRKGKLMLGNTIVRTWQVMKMEWAQVLLEKEDLPVYNAAARVRFHDPFYFSKVFKAHVGLSPRKWQEAKRQA